MRFVNSFEVGEKVILEKFPEFRGRSFAGDDSGWDNFAITLDSEYLFRFPRREDARNQIRREVEVLNTLRPKLPNNIKVPKYLLTNLDADYPFVYYEMIQGAPLTKKLYDTFTDEERTSFVQNISEFLNILHDIDVNSCASLKRINTPDKYQELYQQVVKSCFKYLTPIEQERTRAIFTNYLQNSAFQSFTPTVVHGDLSENHILITEDGIGVIDFGDVSIFDPAIDLSWFYLFDENLFNEVLKQYSAHKDAGFKQRISCFYVPIIPYYGMVYGEETNNSKLFEEELEDLRTNLLDSPNLFEPVYGVVDSGLDGAGRVA